VKKNIKKTLLFFALISVLAFTFTFGGTYAFLTVAGQTAVNDFYIGETRIEIEEKFVQPSGLSPGVGFRKNARAQNTGNLPCFIRAKVVFSSAEAENTLNPLVFDETWILNDGWYYYYGILQPGDYSQFLLRAVYDGYEMKFKDDAENILPFDLTFYIEARGQTDGQTKDDYITVWIGE